MNTKFTDDYYKIIEKDKEKNKKREFFYSAILLFLGWIAFAFIERREIYFRDHCSYRSFGRESARVPPDYDYSNSLCLELLEVKDNSFSLIHFLL
jgi:hypothetical protein